jgi:formyltetrahydrofolate deformylase
MKTAYLLFQSADRTGIIANITNYLLKHSANIISLDQFSTEDEGGIFFLRLVFSYHSSETKLDQIKNEFQSVAKQFQAKWSIFCREKKMKMGVLVSKTDHCLVELLYRWKSKELTVDIPFIISNHTTSRELAQQYEIPFYYLNVSQSDKKEKEILALVQESCDFLVLARYMQILSPNFLKSFGKDIINIHHSFLPSFAGAHPYKQAYERGVKLIGATAHYVTEELDEGPIIEQMVSDVSHKDSINSLINKGKNLEKLTLCQGISDHIEHRVMRYGRKTILFK